MNAPVRKFIETRLIRLDGDTQPREQIDEATVAEYAEAMGDGATFPAVVVFNDGSARWLADGFHRFHATRAAVAAYKAQSGQAGFVAPELLGWIVLAAVAGLMLLGGA